MKIEIEISGDDVRMYYEVGPLEKMTKTSKLGADDILIFGHILQMFSKAAGTDPRQEVAKKAFRDALTEAELYEFIGQEKP